MAKSLFTTCQMKIIDWKKFAIATLDKNKKAFVMHITFFSPNNNHKV